MNPEVLVSEHTKCNEDRMTTRQKNNINAFFLTLRALFGSFAGIHA